MKKRTSTPSGKIIWQGKNFRVYEETLKYNGHSMAYEYVWRRDGTRTIALDQDNRILLTLEYRDELGTKDWRLPGGKLDSENEDLECAAKREFEEETGYTASQWQYLWSTNLDATVRFQRHFFLAKQLIAGTPRRDLGEEIEVYWFTLEEAYNMALDGRIKEDISALSIIRLVHQIKSKG